MATLTEQLAVLASMSPMQLRAEWRRLYRNAPPRLTPDLLQRGLAYRLQERAYGGIPAGIARQLDMLAGRLRRGEALEAKHAARLRSGTRLVRRWNGATYSVLVTEDGFVLGDRSFTSLSHVAEAITGAHWSGPRFFGFDRYLELGSVVATVSALNRDGVTTKRTSTKDGGHRGGIQWMRGALAHLLTNRVYLGEVRHKDQHFPGEHEANITTELWDRAQVQLAGNRVPRAGSTNLNHQNLLRGLLYDGLGRRMQGSQANRGARRYHYYVTNPADVMSTPGQSWRMPAADLEATVVQRLTAFLSNAAALYDVAAATQLPDYALAEFIASANGAAAKIREDHAASLALLRRVDVHDDRVDLTLCIETLMPAGSEHSEPALHQLSVPVARIKRGKDVRMVISDGLPSPTPADPGLIKLIATARSAWQAMVASGDAPLAEVAKSQGYSPEHFTSLLRLSTLAPCIVTAIVEGRQPMPLNRQLLATITNLPKDWAGQRAALGF